MTKLFVLGASGAGKTPIAKQLAAALAVPHVAASQWVRRLFPPAPEEERQAQIEAMTRFSIQQLRENPFACLEFTGREHDLGAPCVIEGMRNPFDFVHAFDPRRDFVLFVDRRDNTLTKTAFERGLDVIRAYLDWLYGAGLLDDDRVLSRTMDTSAEIEAMVAEVTRLVSARFPVATTKPQAPNRVHANIPPLELFVQREILYGGNPAYAGQLVGCRAFAFSSYPGNAPTFKIIVADGAVFSYVAPHQVRWKVNVDEPVLDLRDLAYLNCPDADFVIHELDMLAGDVLCFFKHRDLWMKGTYRFTIDWFTGNDLLHCVLLENGQLALLPHHKIKFHDDAPGFQPYKKMRNEWKLT